MCNARIVSILYIVCKYVRKLQCVCVDERCVQYECNVCNMMDKMDGRK